MITTTRRTLLGASMLSLIGLAGASCSSGSGGEEPTEATASDDVAGSSIRFQVIDGLLPQFTEVVDAYQAAFTDRKVELIPGPSDMDKYLQQLAANRLAGNLPDIIWTYDGLNDRVVNAEVPLDLAPWLAEGKDGLAEAEFVPQFLGQYRPVQNPDMIAGLPVSADSMVVFYNADLFDQFDVAVPAAGWTWDDMFAAATKIYNDSNKEIMGLEGSMGYGAIYGPVLAAKGAKVYDPESNTSDLASDAALSAWELLLQPYGTMMAPYAAQADPNGPNFSNGQAAMSLNVRAFVPNIQDALQARWDVQTMPTLDGKSTTGGGSYGLSISAGSESKNAAWAFLAWLYDADGGSKIMQESGQVIPPLVEGLENGPWRDATVPPNQQAFADAAASATLIAYLPGTAQGVLDASVKTAIEEVLLNDRPLADAFGDAQTKVNDALAQESQ